MYVLLILNKIRHLRRLLLEDSRPLTLKDPVRNMHIHPLVSNEIRQHYTRRSSSSRLAVAVDATTLSQMPINEASSLIELLECGGYEVGGRDYQLVYSQKSPFIGSDGFAYYSICRQLVRLVDATDSINTELLGQMIHMIMQGNG